MFHLGNGTKKLKWAEEDQKIIDPCLADFYAILNGKEPRYAKLDGEQSDELSGVFPSFKWYKGHRYTVTARKTLIRIGGVAGYLHGAEVNFDGGFGHHPPEPVALSDIAFYSPEEIEQTARSDSKRGATPPTMFHLGTGKGKLRWPARGEKVINACLADSGALLSGRKPVHARLNPDRGKELSNLASKSEWYTGDNYEIWVTRTGGVIGGLNGFLYGVRLYFDRGFVEQEFGDVVLSHVAFYSYDELEKLLGRKALEGP